jgi:RNA polymerase sigma factor (sigma-70 family)
MDNNYKRMVSFTRNRFRQFAHKDGEDIVQDVMLNLLNKADFVAPIENLTAYVFKCLRNKIIDELRKDSQDNISLNSVLCENSSLEFIELVQCVDEEYEDSYELLYNALAQLPQNQNYVIVQNELKGRRLKDIALELNVPLGTLLARKSRGMKQLRIIIETMEDKDVYL